MFVAHIVQEYAGSEIDWDTTRLLFFDAIKSNDDFPLMFTLSLNAECSYVEGTMLLLNSPITFIHYKLSCEDYSLLKHMLSNY